MKLHIVQFLHEIRAAGGGVTRAVLDLSAAIARLGHRVTLLTLDAADAPAGWPRVASLGELASMPPQEKPVVFVPASATPGRRFAGRRVRHAVADLVASADVLHLHGVWEWCNVQAIAIARRAGVPVVLTPHGMLDDWSMSQGGFKKRLFLRFALTPNVWRNLHVHFTATAEASAAERYIGDAGSSVIPYVVNVEPFLSAHPRETDAEADGTRRVPATLAAPPHVLLLSRLHPKKGVELLIDAAAHLARRRPNVRYTIAGPGDEAYLAALRQRVRDRGLESAVRFTGMVSGDAKIALYRSADLFVLPTSQENFGLVLIEAMAGGVAVVTTKGVDIWPELEAAGASIVAADPEAIADAIGQLLADAGERDRRAARGRAWVTETFGGDAIARRFEAMYLEPTQNVEGTRGAKPGVPST